ncbi:MAG TPA: hypothetical protein PKZ76_12405 [Xanthomonadaceae bacterium]|nr:hypothetical protein [Xanthomonadaceae bacterium]
MTRTTVTLDPVVEQFLRDAMQQRHPSFRRALNQAVVHTADCDFLCSPGLRCRFPLGA